MFLEKISKLLVFSKRINYELKNYRVFLIISLGVAGMFINFRYLLSDIKISGYKKEYWLIRDSSHHLNRKKILSLDTLRVIYHPSIGIRQDSSRKLHQFTNSHKIPFEKIEGYHNLKYDRLYFAYNPNFLVWIAFASIVAGCGLAFLPIIYDGIKNIITQFNLGVKTICFIFFFTTLIGLLIYLTDNIDYIMGTISVVREFDILLNHPDRLLRYLTIGLFVGLMGFAGQLTVNSAIRNFPENLIGLDLDKQRLWGRKFLLLRKQLMLFLIIDSVMVVFSVLTTDALKQAILSEINVNMEILPQNFVYLYGLMFTFYLGIIYIPIYARLKQKGEQMLEGIFPESSESEKIEITSVFKIEQTPIERMQIVISILAPVLSSLVPGVLKI